MDAVTPRALDDPRLTVVGLLAETYAGLRAKLTPAIAAHGLSPVEFEVLLRLGRSSCGRLRMTDLAAQADLSASGVTRVVDRLERSGRVRREMCPADRRGAFAVLTEEGFRTLVNVVPAHVSAVERWVTSALTPEQLAALVDALRAIRLRVRPGATAGTAEASPADGRGSPGGPAGGQAATDAGEPE